MGLLKLILYIYFSLLKILFVLLVGERKSGIIESGRSDIFTGGSYLNQNSTSLIYFNVINPNKHTEEKKDCHFLALKIVTTTLILKSTVSRSKKTTLIDKSFYSHCSFQNFLLDVAWTSIRWDHESLGNRHDQIMKCNFMILCKWQRSWILHSF